MFVQCNLLTVAYMLSTMHLLLTAINSLISNLPLFRPLSNLFSVTMDQRAIAKFTLP